MKYSLINVSREYDGMVDGVWLQNHTGTIASAAEAARATERANSNRINVAVVEDLGYTEPNYSVRTGLKRLYLVQDLKMDLREFLSYFDFDYDIVSPGDKYEDRIRQELLEDGDLSPDDVNKDLICLVDIQGAYFGNIGKSRFPISQASVEKIIDRMDIYVQDSVIDEFTTALEDRDIDTSKMSLGEMITKCKDLNVGEGEVCYSLAEAVNSPESIYIQEVLEQEKDDILLDFGNIVSELETKNLKLLKIKDNNSLFVVDCEGNLYGIERYYAGGYLDRFIGEKFVISFERMEEPTRNFEDWRKEFMDASYVKSFIERVVKREYPNFTQTHKPLTAQIQEAEARATAPCPDESLAKNMPSQTR